MPLGSIQIGGGGFGTLLRAMLMASFGSLVTLAAVSMIGVGDWLKENFVQFAEKVRINTTLLLPIILLILTTGGCKSNGWLKQIEWSAVAIVVQVLIAAVGAMIGFSIRQNTAKQQQLESDRVDREQKVQDKRDQLRAFDGYRRELGRFTDAVIDVMGEIQTLIAFDPDRAEIPANARQRFVEQRSRLISRVSSLLDRGRFFFPNREVSNTGEHKGPAQEGLRDPVLNRILAASYVLMATDYESFDRNRKRWIRWETLTTVTKGSAGHVGSAFRLLSKTEQSRLADELTKERGIRLMDLIVSAKRAFVSEMFSIMQPRNWLKEVEHAYGIDLLSRKREGPVDHISDTRSVVTKGRGESGSLGPR